MSTPTPKKRRLEAAVQSIQHKWGNAALRKGARPIATSIVPSLPSGLARLDQILAIGGLPLGHITELIGQPTSGKRTLALHILAQAQARFPCLYLDLAQTFDPAYAAACRVDLSRLILAAPADPAQALDLATDLAAGGHFGLLIFDSTAELLAGNFAPGAAMAALRRLGQALHGKHTALLFLTTTFFGPPDSPANYPPGFHLNQAAAVRLLLSRQRWLRRQGSVRGYQARISVLRHRWDQPGKEATVDVAFNGVHMAEAQDP